MRRSRLSKYFVLFFLSLFLISFFALNTFADDVDAVTRAAPQVSPNRDVTPSFWEIQARDAESVAARSNALIASQQRLNLPDNPLVNQIGNGARLLFGIIANQWVIMLLTLILVTILFYAVFSIGLMNIPLFKENTDPEKKRHMRMIAMTLAMLSSIGLLGYAGFDRGRFDINNILIRTSNLLNAFGMIGVWFFSALLGGIIYFSGKKVSNEHLDPGPYERAKAWGLSVSASGASLWLGSSLLGSPWTFLGALMFFGGVIALLWPRKMSDGTNPSGGAAAAGPAGPAGTPETPPDNGAGPATPFPSHLHKVEALLKEQEKSKKNIPGKLKRIFVHANFLSRTLNKEYQFLENIEKLLKDFMSNFDQSLPPANWKKDFKEIKNDIDKGFLLRFAQRNARREYRLMNTIGDFFINKRTTYETLEKIAPNELQDSIRKELEIIKTSINYIKEFDKILIAIQSEVSELKSKWNDLKSISDEIGKKLNSKKGKEKIYSDINSRLHTMKNNLNELINGFTTIEKLSNFENNQLIQIRDFVKYNFETDEELKKIVTNKKDCNKQKR